MYPTNSVYYYLGADVEFFIKNKRSVVSSDKLITEKLSFADRQHHTSAIIRDGFQVEFNLYPSSCRAFVTESLRRSFLKLDEELSKKKLSLSEKGVIEIPKTQFEKLDKESKMFGCDPSYNMHTKSESVITVDPTVYRKRSAGGHIHIGSGYGDNIDKLSEYRKKEYNAFRNENLIILYDIIVGNTCVLLDRDPDQVERRKVYGRAGEYRPKPYGIEYRVLSNFWTKHCALASFVLGLAKLPIMLIHNYEERAKEIIDNSNINDVISAINNNDFGLALQNYKRIEQFLYSFCGTDNCYLPFGKSTKELYFKHLVLTNMKDIIPDNFNTIKYWKNETEDGHYTGFDTYANRWYDLANANTPMAVASISDQWMKLK